MRYVAHRAAHERRSTPRSWRRSSASRATTSSPTARSSRSRTASRASPGSSGAARERVPVFLYALRPAAPRGRGPAPAAAARAQGAPAPRARLRRARCASTRTATASTARSCTGRRAEKGLEGVIAKRADSPYCAAARSRDWLKLKCHAEQELVIGGYTAPKGSRTEFGALLVGYYEDGGAPLRRQGRHRLRPRDAARRSARACASSSRTSRRSSRSSRSRRARTGCGPSWWRRSASREWTRDGRLRHPRFLGLRDDKPAPRGRARACRREHRRDHAPRQGAVPRRRDHEGGPRLVLRARVRTGCCRT